MSEHSRPSGFSPLAIVAMAVVGLIVVRWLFGVARALTSGLLWIAVIAAIVLLVFSFRRE